MVVMRQMIFVCGPWLILRKKDMNIMAAGAPAPDDAKPSAATMGNVDVLVLIWGRISPSYDVSLLGRALELCLFQTLSLLSLYLSQYEIFRALLLREISTENWAWISNKVPYLLWGVILIQILNSTVV